MAAGRSRLAAADPSPPPREDESSAGRDGLRGARVEAVRPRALSPGLTLERRDILDQPAVNSRVPAATVDSAKLVVFICGLILRRASVVASNGMDVRPGRYSSRVPGWGSSACLKLFGALPAAHACGSSSRPAGIAAPAKTASTLFRTG